MGNPSADLSQKFGSQPVCHCKLMSIESIEVKLVSKKDG